jgi:hypothetical protein
VIVSALDLLDSARHKLNLARYHADSLLVVLAQHPHEGPDEPLRFLSRPTSRVSPLDELEALLIRAEELATPVAVP